MVKESLKLTSVIHSFNKTHDKQPNNKLFNAKHGTY
jgi:hypothetical protein